MSCGFDREIIHRYADNTIDPLEFIFLKEHINYCSGCRRELDAVMTLESELGKFFDYDIDTSELDLMIAKLVDDCIYEVSRKERLKYILGRGMAISGGIAGNAMRFVDFIPGSRRVGKGAKRTASAAGNLLVSMVKKRVVKLFAAVR